MISIIIPIFNSQLTIKRCIESVIKQTYTDWELLLINDGSNDKSEFICKEFAAIDSRITFINKINTGVSDTRNVGINKAKGEYICFIDSDDFVEKNYLEELYKGKDYDLSFVGISKYNLDFESKEENMTDLRESKFKISEDSYNENIIINNDLFAVGSPCAKLFKRYIIENLNIRFDTRIKNHEDHIFYFDYLINCNSIYISDKILYFYTYRKNSISLSHTTPHYNNLILASDLFLERYSKLFKHYKISNKDYIQRITSEYGIGTRRAAIFSLYKYNNNKNERIEILLKEAENFRKWYKIYNYKPKNIKHKLIYLFICNKFIKPKIKDYLLRKLYI